MPYIGAIKTIIHTHGLIGGESRGRRRSHQHHAPHSPAPKAKLHHNSQFTCPRPGRRPTAAPCPVAHSSPGWRFTRKMNAELEHLESTLTRGTYRRGHEYTVVSVQLHTLRYRLRLPPRGPPTTRACGTVGSQDSSSSSGHSSSGHSSSSHSDHTSESSTSRASRIVTSSPPPHSSHRSRRRLCLQT